ncbi:hypothetical protein D3C79_728790 [compost metagenome]
MAVTFSQQFIGALAGGVQRNGMIDRVLDTERHLAVGAVHRTARGVDQVVGAMVPTGFQHIEETHQVRLPVDIRVVQRVAHPGLGRQVHHLGKSVLLKQAHQGRFVDDVHFPEAKTRQSLQHLEACVLEFHVVIVVEVIDTNDLLTLAAQALDRMKADETGRTGDQDGHGKRAGDCAAIDAR